jgi:glycerophosphoryl diester phosphodiesterase
MRLSPFAPIDAAFAPAPDPARTAWLRGQTFAHRGAHDYIQGGSRIENSSAAFAEAIRRGLGIECDVQRSRDGRAMVFHDWELDRLTGESGPVAARAAAALGRIALKGSGEGIPTLDALLDQVAGRVPLLIEIKSRREVRPIPLCLAVRRALEGYRGEHAVMSFDPRVVRWFALHSPDTLRGLVMTEEHDRGARGAARRHSALWLSRAQFLAYDVRDLPSRFAAAQRRRGLPLLTWTVRSPELAERAAAEADSPIAEGTGLAG